MKRETHLGRKFSISSGFFLDFSSLIFLKGRKIPSLMDFSLVIKTRSVSVTKNGKDTPEQCCRSELIDRENASN